MKNTGINPTVIRQICFFAEANGIDRVVLFGSRARGDYDRASDIDLAVFGGDSDSFHYDIENKTDTLLTYDVVKLEANTNKKLVDSVMKEGISIYEKI